MAGTKLTITRKIAGSTIVEVLISMVIIIVAFGIAMMIYSNVTRFSLSAKKIKAEAILQERLLDIEQSKVRMDETVAIGDFQVQQEIKVYSDSSHLSDVHLTAWDDNHQKVAELQKVIIIP